MHSHAHDLRVEVGEVELARHLLRHGWLDAPLSEAERAMCGYAEKLTRSPTEMAESDVIQLREHGWNDRAINDACQIIAYFNYINRIADGLGIEAEPDIDEN
jgi:uncharacterized peroxidase-related enzyme